MSPAQEHHPEQEHHPGEREDEGAARAGDGEDPAAHRAAADRLLTDEGRRQWGRTTALFLCATGSSGAALALPAALGRTLDLLLAGRLAGGWLVLCAALTCALVALDAADTVLTGTLNSRTTARLRSRLTGHLLALGPARAGRFSHGDLVTRCTGNAAHAGTGPSTAACALAALATPLGGLVALALLDWRLAAVFLAGAPLLVLLLRAFSRTSTDCVIRYQEVQARIAGRLVEALGGARTLAAGGILEREGARVLGPLPSLSAQGHRTWRVQGRATAQAAVLVPLLQVAVVAVGGVLLSSGALSVGGLVAAARYAVLAAGVGTLVGQLNGLVRGRTAARRLAEVLAVPGIPHGHLTLPGPLPEPPPGPSSGPLPESPPPVRRGQPVPLGRLELRGVWASYDGRAVLRGVDLTVPAGSTVAVVGRSGAGKSLLAALAGRLAEPESGQVLLDGTDLALLERTDLRRAVGFAFERPVLFGGTVAEAIGAGLPPGSGPSRSQVREAARAACADGFVRTLPRGYDTPCAEAPLSGGEVQRLGLARAFAHGGRLLILDDATSSLDTVTELKVSQALWSRAARSRTRLVVAHRASSAARADLTAWLEDGRIRALAPHAELWQVPGYRALFGSGNRTSRADVDPAARERPEEADARQGDARQGDARQTDPRPPGARKAGFRDG